MEIKINSKFNIGDFKRIKHSTTQKFLITEIFIVACKESTQILYKGLRYIKKENLRIPSMKSWGKQEEIKEEAENWVADELFRISELLLED